MKRAVLIAAVLLATLAGLAMCGGTTGREGLVTPGGPEEAGVTVDAGPVEAAAVSAMYQDAYDVMITYADRELPALDAGASSDAAPMNEAGVVPCTQGGQTGCVACNKNLTGVCTATEALVVWRDIDKGLFSVVDGGWMGTSAPDGGVEGGPVEGVHAVGTPNVYPVPDDAGPTLPPSCYACLVAKHGLDSSSATAHLHECDDLDPLGVIKGSSYKKLCLDVLACTLGQPVAGSSPWRSCADDSPADASPVGWANCYCGAAEPDVASCNIAMPPSAQHTTGGPGVASPNGACLQQMLDGVGDQLSTAPTQALTDFGQTTLPTGRALVSILTVAGTQVQVPACPQCFR
jgi:hypothetical protein